MKMVPKVDSYKVLKYEIKRAKYNESILFYLYGKILLMQVVDVLNLLNKWAPLTYSEEFDNTGLLVGSSHTKVKGILVCLDTLDTVVEEAVKNDCNLIVSFHPIIFSGLKSLSPKDHVTKSVTKAIKNSPSSRSTAANTEKSDPQRGSLRVTSGLEALFPRNQPPS